MALIETFFRVAVIGTLTLLRICMMVLRTLLAGKNPGAEPEDEDCSLNNFQGDGALIIIYPHPICQIF